MIYFGLLVLLSGITLMILSIFNKFRFKTYKLNEQYRPYVSLVVPAHNEATVIERTIQGFLKTTYPSDKKEMIIINDASTDNTREIVEKYATKIIDASTANINKIVRNPQNPNNIILINRKEGGHGKSLALNAGKAFAQGDVLFFTDADIQLSSKVFENAVRHLSEKCVGGVAGYVEVKNKSTFLSRFIDFEYVTGQKLLRRGFNVLGVHYIVPGGCAVFKKATLDKVGDYHNDTLAEDTDMTWRVLTETCDKIHFDPSVRVGADEPHELKSLWNQRVRWARGNIEVTIKNWKKAFKSKYGRALTWVYPFWLSSIVLPFAFILSACGLGLAYALNVSLILPFVGKFLAITFFASWIVGTALNKGASWLEGLLAPGVPLLITLFAMLFWDNGFGGLLTYFGFTQSAGVLQLIIGMWILVALPGTYFCVYVLKKYSRFATFLQLFVFGYWMFLVTSVFHGYLLEALRKEKKWVRTER